MSRGIQTAREDEAVAIYAIGEAINHITLDIMYENQDTRSYDQIRSGIAEGFAYWLKDEFKKSKYY